MTAREVIDKIRSLNIPGKAKEQLLLLYTRARNLVIGILKFMERHRQFAEAMLLGAVIAYLLSKIPWIGMFLSLCCLVTFAAIGIARELHEDLAKLLDPIPA